MKEIGLFVLDESTVIPGSVRIAYKDDDYGVPTMRISEMGFAMMLEIPVIAGVDLDEI